jgi:hypothetical protein
MAIIGNAEKFCKRETADWVAELGTCVVASVAESIGSFQLNKRNHLKHPRSL